MEQRQVCPFTIDEHIRTIGNDLFQGSTVYIVDSMSAFGAIPVHLHRDHITYLISSANKCIEGIPGFAFVICQQEHLLTCQGE
jgi:2-aminoethylphosphonate-pyruvate transaminase